MRDEKLRARIERARQAGERTLLEAPRAASVRYLEDAGELVLRLADGSDVRIPVRHLQVLSDASPSEIRDVEIVQQGLALHWDALDAHFTVSGLANGTYGTRAWMKTIGRKGGRATSAAKRRASRENGRRGGRPRTSARPAMPASERRSDETVSKTRLIEKVSADTGVSKKIVKTVVDELLEHVADAALEGKEVKLRGFGTFVAENRSESDATGAPRSSAAGKKITFRPSDKIGVSAGSDGEST